MEKGDKKYFNTVYTVDIFAPKIDLNKSFALYDGELLLKFPLYPQNILSLVQKKYYPPYIHRLKFYRPFSE